VTVALGKNLLNGRGLCVKNAISVDVEDWFCVNNLWHAISRDEWDRCELRVRRGTERILGLLDRHSAKGTFFVLGWMAERVPGLVKEIEQRGHEVGTHGYSHALLTEMTRETFAADLDLALDVTGSLVAQKILGFRAPSFTLTRQTWWSLDVLNEHGIRYDSSLFPIGFHPDYGVPDAPLEIHNIKGALIEVPLSCAEFAGRRLPCCGGGYFRICPYPMTRRLIRRCRRQNRPVVFYVHPWELDADQIRCWCDYARRKNYLRPRYVAYKLVQQFRQPSEIRRTVKFAKRFVRFLVPAAQQCS
jgi:polysaccharide deacetylase family protein (PEP-CTERM system associated)